MQNVGLRFLCVHLLLSITQQHRLGDLQREVYLSSWLHLALTLLLVASQEAQGIL